MYAIVEIGGQQFKVSKDDVIKTQLLQNKVGDKIEFDKVLFVSDDKNVKVGTPVVKNAKIEGTIVDQMKDKKVTIFKKKRRKGYRVKRGHRQPLTRVKIDNIVLK